MFQPNFCIFLYPFVKKEIVALLLNRNTEAGRLLGSSTGILEHFSAALHQIAIANEKTRHLLASRKFLSCLVIIFPPVAFR